MVFFGVGWGDVNIPDTCTHGVDSTQLMGLGWVGVMLTFMILAHMVDATQLMGLGWGGSGSDS